MSTDLQFDLFLPEGSGELETSVSTAARVGSHPSAEMMTEVHEDWSSKGSFESELSVRFRVEYKGECSRLVSGELLL